MTIRKYSPLNAGEIVISRFPKVTGFATDDTLANFIDAVCHHTPQYVVDLITELRGFDKTTDPDRYRDIKNKLPAYTLSCRCTPGQTHKEHDNTHTGVIAVDIDAADNPQVNDWGALRDALGLLPYCYLSALSAGGKGVFVLIAIYPAQSHPMVFDALRRYFADTLHINIDKSCRNINRLRFISYDPEAVVNKQPEECFIAVQCVPHTPKPRAKMYARPGSRTFSPGGRGDDYDRIRAAAAVWARKGLPLDNHADWVKVAASLKELPDGEDLFHLVSKTSEKYKTAETERKYHKVDLPLVHPGSFIHLCRQYGITDREINEALHDIKATSISSQQPQSISRS